MFTSSAGLYTVEDGSHCNEDSPTAKLGSSDRTDRCAILQLEHRAFLLRLSSVRLLCRLLKAEQTVLKAGGNVVRFVGLYHADRYSLMLCCTNLKHDVQCDKLPAGHCLSFSIVVSSVMQGRTHFLHQTREGCALGRVHCEPHSL